MFKKLLLAALFLATTANVSGRIPGVKRSHEVGNALEKRQSIPISSLPAQCQKICALGINALNSIGKCTSATCICNKAVDSSFQGCIDCIEKVEPAEVQTLKQLASEYNELCAGTGVSSLTVGPVPSTTAKSSTSKSKPTSTHSSTGKTSSTSSPTSTTSSTSSTASGTSTSASSTDTSTPTSTSDTGSSTGSSSLSSATSASSATSVTTVTPTSLTSNSATLTPSSTSGTIASASATSSNGAITRANAGVEYPILMALIATIFSLAF